MVLHCAEPFIIITSYSWYDFTFTTLWAFSADDKLIILFLILPRKQDLTFHANCLLRRQFAWNVKSCFLGKNKKNISKCRLLKILPRVLSVNIEEDIKHQISCSRQHSSLFFSFYAPAIFIGGACSITTVRMYIRAYVPYEKWFPFVFFWKV